MKRSSITLAFAFMVFVFGCNTREDLISIEVFTESKSENLIAEYAIEKLAGNARLVSVSITNTGNETEYIEDIQIKLEKTPLFNDGSQFMYFAYDMRKDPVQQYGYNDPQSFTESVLLVKNSNAQYYKVGILSWKIFRAAIAFSKENGLIVSASGEGKPINPGETIQFEKFVIEESSDWQDLLFSYGEQIAKINNIKPQEIGRWKGWGSWDYLGHDFSVEDITSNMEQIKAIDETSNLIQIDASWWVNRGDYFETRPELTGGMKRIAKQILNNGLVAGIHLDGMRAVTTSNVYKENPDWFLKDQDGNTIYQHFTRSDGRKEVRVFFDYSNPAACEYIKNVLRNMVNNWGYKYIKIDFLWFGLDKNIKSVVNDPNLKKIVGYDPTMTGMERSRAGFKAMREGIGSGYFLGCSSVFGPNYGFIDGLRTGPDIDPRFEAYQTHMLQNAGNFFLNQSVVQTDADYLVVRNKDDEDPKRAQGRNKFGGDVTFNEAAMWADYIALFGGIKLASDDLNVLRPKRKELIKRAFSINTCTRFVPIDLWDKAKNPEDAFCIMLGTNDQGVYLALFNWDYDDLGIHLSNIPSQGIEVISYYESPNFNTGNESITVQMKPRTSMILKLNNSADFDKIRRQLTYEFSQLVD
jgi:alpha-galactosidase